MKKRAFIIVVAVILLGVGALGIWSYLSLGNMTFTKLMYILKLNGFKVEDISEQEAAKHPNPNKPDEYEAKVIAVSGEPVIVLICTGETLQSVLEKEKSTMQNPLIDWAKKPHLYGKDNIAVLYFGKDERLLKALEKMFGESLVG